jgi:hypothetical protein
MPKRRFESAEEFWDTIKDAGEIIVDGTEILTERPKGRENQKVKYSGKKHAHTDIALVISNIATWIYYVSKLYPGKNVDMGIMKLEFLPGKGWFKTKRALFDLGFIGIDKIYKFKELVIGEKRPRKSKKSPKPELTEEQKERNKSISQERIFVEHAIGGMKKFRILKNKCRLKNDGLKDKILGICAGLWNYQLLLKHS